MLLTFFSPSESDDTSSSLVRLISLRMMSLLISDCLTLFLVYSVDFRSSSRSNLSFLCFSSRSFISFPIFWLSYSSMSFLTPGLIPDLFVLTHIYCPGIRIFFYVIELLLSTEIASSVRAIRFLLANSSSFSFSSNFLFKLVLTSFFLFGIVLSE